jgi:hypothetical protein
MLQIELPGEELNTVLKDTSATAWKPGEEHRTPGWTEISRNFE